MKIKLEIDKFIGEFDAIRWMDYSLLGQEFAGGIVRQSYRLHGTCRPSTCSFHSALMNVIFLDGREKDEVWLWGGRPCIIERII